MTNGEDWFLDNPLFTIQNVPIKSYYLQPT